MLTKNKKLSEIKNKFLSLSNKILLKVGLKKHRYFFQNSLDQKLVKQLSSRKIPSLKQLQQLHRFLSPTEKKIIKSLLAVILLSSMLWSADFYVRHTSLVPSSGGEYTEGIIGSPHYLNPLFSKANDVDNDLVSLVYSGLLKYNNLDHSFQPDLCQKYNISEDQKTFTFYLRENIFWQDGEPINSNDIIFTYELTKYPSVNSPWRPFTQNLSLEKIDNLTVKITSPLPIQNINVFTVGLLPKHIWENINVNNITLAEYNLKPIGSGPYQVDSFIKDNAGNIKSYILISNPYYYLPKPYIQKLTFVFTDNKEELFGYLQSRSVQGAGFIDFNKEETIKEHFQSFPLLFNQYIAVFFNQQNNKYLTKNVRYALRATIDKKALINQVVKTGKIINSPLLFKETKEGTFFDLEKARDLLKKENWEKDEKGFLYKEDKKEKEKKYLTIKLTIPRSERNQQIAEMIKKYWEKIGIKTEIEPLDSSALQSKIKEKKYETLLYGENLGYNYDLYPFWHSSEAEKGKTNLALFKNKEADKLLEQINKNPERKKENLEKFEKIIQEECPAIFLYEPVYYYLVDKNIKNVKMSNIVTPADRFSNILHWYIKTKKEFSW